LYAVVGALISLFKGKIKCFVRDVASFYGRLVVFVKYETS